MKKTILLLLTLSFAIFQAFAQSYNWEEQQITERNENIQGFAIANDSTATLIGYGNIMQQTTDGGETWNNLGIFETDDFDYQDISFYGQTGFAVAMTGYKMIDRPAGGSPDLYANSPLLKTTDGGDSWELISVENMGDGSDCSIHPSAPGNYSVKFSCVEIINDTTVYLGAYWKDANSKAHQTVLKSCDTGATWKVLLPDNGNNTFNAIIAYNENIYITGNKTLYKVSIATDYITNLYPIIDEGEDDKMFIWHPSICGNELIFPTSADSIRVTNDEGATFTTIPNIKKGYYVYKKDSNIVVCCSTDDTKTSSDGGANWTLNSAGTSLWKGEVIGDSLVALANKATYSMSTDDIANGVFNWTKNTVTDISGNLKGICASNNSIYITGYSNILLRSTDGAQSFSAMTIPSESDIIYASVDLDTKGLSQGKGKAGLASTRRHKLADYPSSGPDDIYVPAFLFATVDNWATFTVLDDSKIGEKYDTAYANPYAEGCYGQDFFEVACIDDSTYLTFVQWYDTASTDDLQTYGRVFKSCDAGESWDTITSDLAKGFVTTICADENDIYIGGGNILLHSNDGGTTMHNLIEKLEDLGATKPYIQDIVKKGDTLYIPTTSDSIFISYDNGTSFSVIPNISGASGLVALDHDSWMTIGSDSKTRYTNNGGAAWENCTPGPTLYSSGGIFNGHIIGLTKSKIYKLPIADLAYKTSSALEKAPVSSSHITLWQDESSLNIQAEQAIVNLKIYSINGQLQYQERSNNNTLTINTSHLSKGIYLLNINTANQSYSEKIIIR